MRRAGFFSAPSYPLPLDRIILALEPHVHESHAEIVKRLKRTEGHLRAIITMITDGRPCVDVAQQMQAVEAAIHGAKQAFIRDHIDHCLEDHLATGQSPANTLREFKDIAKYL